MNPLPPLAARYLRFYVLTLLMSICTSPVWAGPYKPARIAMIQYNGDIHFGDRATNMQNLTRLATEAVQGGAKLIIMPEGSINGYATATETWCKPGMDVVTNPRTGAQRKCRDVSAIAEEIPSGPTSRYWLEFAKKHQAYVLYQMPEKSGGQYYVTLAVAGPNGFVMSYHKRSLYWLDEAYATAGAEPGILETPFGKFGLMICRDATYKTEIYDDLVSANVNAILVSMDWDDDPTTGSEWVARTRFQNMAMDYAVDMFASDSSPWDGTGSYLHKNEERVRSAGLPEIAIGVDGVVFHDVDYSQDSRNVCQEALQSESDTKQNKNTF